MPAGEDVIRTAFIYDPATTELVGDPQILVGATAFDNAREPSAQAFKAKGGADADGFAVIANHFKSKGSGTPDPDGQGNANDSTGGPGSRAGDLRRRLRSVARHREGLPDR